MIIEADTVAIITEDGRRPTSGPPDGMPPPSRPTASQAATQLSFAAASNQFSAVARFPFAPVDAPSVEDEALADARTRWDHAQLFARDGVITIGAHGVYADAQAYVHAVEAIEAKAKSLGYDVQSLAVDVTAVPGGYVGAYPGNDIYAQPGGDAFEVHGDIRAKYNALGGPAGLLGLPETDELGAPDGVGRYNHFQYGSIYWTPHTGPMAVHGTVRDRWAASGWERGPLGYPVQDQHRMVLNTPVRGRSRRRSNLPVEWCRFENGLIAG